MYNALITFKNKEGVIALGGNRKNDRRRIVRVENRWEGNCTGMQK